MDFFWYSQLKKDFLVDFSYKISFFGQFLGIFLTVLSFFFISEIFIGSQSIHLEQFNYDYFIFATLGIAILDMVITIMRTLTTSLREAQSFGYVEMFFISRINSSYLFLCCSIYPFIKGSIRFIAYILLLQLASEHTFLTSSILIAFFFTFINDYSIFSVIFFSALICFIF